MTGTGIRAVRTAAIVLGAIAFCASFSPASNAAANEEPYRMLEQPLGYFTCSSGTHWVLSSRNEAVAFLDDLGERCSRPPDAAKWRDAFLRELDRAGVDFDRESVVLLQKVYGSGMINARLVFALEPKGTLRADMQSIVPKPPLTPDIAIRKFAFAVDRTKVRKVAIHFDGKKSEIIDLP